MKNSKIVYTEYEMQDGEVVAMSLSQILLLNLRNKDKDAYKRLSKTMIKGIDTEDVLCMYQFLYDAYLCANQDEDTMTFTEFLEKGNQDFQYNTEICGGLINPTKKPSSEQPLKEQ